MIKDPKYVWNSKEGIASCTIYYGKLKFVGTAFCHPEDEDMKSKLTGITIAEARAALSYFRHVRTNELKPQLKSLKQLYYSMNRSKHYNPKSYESRMLRRQICILENDLAIVKEEIANTKKIIRTYIDQKENDHNRIRAYRAKQQLAKDNQ